jgi:two-component system cell cycle response regulator
MDRRTPATVLLIEGRDAFRTEYAAALRPSGLEVIAVGNSQVALEAVRSRHPRVIVAGLDPQTRDDRLDFCRQIKRDPDTRDIPILLTTDNVTPEDVALAEDPGVLVLTIAAHDESKLIAAINGVLTAQRARPLPATLSRRRDMKRPA